jgi:hypothetical protein
LPPVFSGNFALGGDGGTDWSARNNNGGNGGTGGGRRTLGGRRHRDPVQCHRAKQRDPWWEPGLRGSTYGLGFDGGIYAAGGTVTLCGDTVESNSVDGYGGGFFISANAKVYIDSFTVANTISNTDRSSGTNGITADIDGTYILQNC